MMKKAQFGTFPKLTEPNKFGYDQGCTFCGTKMSEKDLKCSNCGKHRGQMTWGAPPNEEFLINKPVEGSMKTAQNLFDTGINDQSLKDFEVVLQKNKIPQQTITTLLEGLKRAIPKTQAPAQEPTQNTTQPSTQPMQNTTKQTMTPIGKKLVVKVADNTSKEQEAKDLAHKIVQDTESLKAPVLLVKKYNLPLDKATDIFDKAQYAFGIDDKGENWLERSITRVLAPKVVVRDMTKSGQLEDVPPSDIEDGPVDSGEPVQLTITKDDLWLLRQMTGDATRNLVDLNTSFGTGQVEITEEQLERLSDEAYDFNDIVVEKYGEFEPGSQEEDHLYDLADAVESWIDKLDELEDESRKEGWKKLDKELPEPKMGTVKNAREPDYVDLPDEYEGPIPYDIIFVKGADVDNFWEEIWTAFSLDEVRRVESDDRQEEMIWYIDVDQHAEDEFNTFMEGQKAKGIVKYYETSIPIEDEYDMKVWGKKAQKEEVDESDMHPLTYDDLDEFNSDNATDAKDFVDANDVEEARALGEELGVDWDSVDFTPEDLLIGMGVELEHGNMYPDTNVTDDAIEMTCLIALSHLNEDPKYYNKLVKMEKTSQKHYHNRYPSKEEKELIHSIQKVISTYELSFDLSDILADIAGNSEDKAYGYADTLGDLNLEDLKRVYNYLAKRVDEEQLSSTSLPKKIAVSELESAIDSIIDVDTVLNTVSTKGWNQQMKNMFNEVYSELWNRMKFDADTQEALVRLLDVVQNARSYQPDLITNILAKAQHALGLKTPIMF